MLGGLVGGLLGGSKKSESQASGFAAMPKEVQDFMLKTLFPQIQDQAAAPYQGIPRRRINASDADPIFGSQARQGMQEYKDALAMMRGMQGSGKPTASAFPPMETERDAATGLSYMKGKRSGNKYDPGYYSMESANSLGTQGISGPQSGYVMEMLKQLQKGAA